MPAFARKSGHEYKPVEMSAQAGKVDDQGIIFLTDGGGDLVGDVLFRLDTIVADIDSPVLTFQHTLDDRRFYHLCNLVSLIAGQDFFQLSNRIIDNGFQFLHRPLPLQVHEPNLGD